MRSSTRTAPTRSPPLRAQHAVLDELSHVCVIEAEVLAQYLGVVLAEERRLQGRQLGELGELEREARNRHLAEDRILHTADHFARSKIGMAHGVGDREDGSR